jgi:serine/threonine-protein kinase HipA
MEGLAMLERITIEIRLWGVRIGAASMTRDDPFASFQYADEFLDSKIQVSPLVMPLASEPYRFPELARETFHGLPGMLADSLPDKFGNELIDAWLAQNAREPSSFTALERLCYTGLRGMGALEFHPERGPRPGQNATLEIDKLVSLTSEILSRRTELDANLSTATREKAMREILRVGTSAGGSRAKAVVTWNSETNEIRSGQVAAGKGFTYWILKFDGVSRNGDKELADPQGYGAIEYAYYLMASAAGISMCECRILEEGGRRHFMTKRFDRLEGGAKLHMQSLGAIAHYDFNRAGAYSYEQAFQVIRRMGLSVSDEEQMFRRMVFNIVARNQDDHVKNIAFLMDKRGSWSLAPAFDMVYNYQPTGRWTSSQQMSLRGKRDGFTLSDFRECAKLAGLKQRQSDVIVREIVRVVSRWPEYAEKAGVSVKKRDAILKTLRLAFEP